MKRILLLLLITFAAWAQAPKTITTPTFEVTVPDTWEEARTPSAVYLLYPGKDVSQPEKENINITPTLNSDGMSLDMYTFMAKHTVESQRPELKLTSSKPAPLGKLSGHRFEYTGIVGGKKYILIQVMALHLKNGYTVEFSGSEADFKTVRSSFDAMLRGFKAK